MGVVAKAGATFTPAPAGVHQAVCCDIVDLGMVTTEWEGKKRTSHKVYVIWQISEKHPEKGERFTVRKRYTVSLHEKSALRKDLQSWRGRPFTGEELRGFDLDNVLGANAQLNIVHKDVDGSIFANVEAIMPLAKGMPKLEVENYVRVKDRPKDSEQGGDFQASDEDVPF